MKINYKGLYLELKEKYELLQKKSGTKEPLVIQCYSLLNINNNHAKKSNIHLTSGYFLYKLTMNELIFLIEVLKCKQKNPKKN